MQPVAPFWALQSDKCKWSSVMKICRHACKQPSSWSPHMHQYWFLSGRSLWANEQGQRWTEEMELRGEESSRCGLCRETLEWWKDRAMKWNFSELCFTAQCHRAFCGLYQHTRNDSHWQHRSIAWQHPLPHSRSHDPTGLLYTYLVTGISREKLGLTSACTLI